MVAADIGGTHARFALAAIDSGQVIDLAQKIYRRWPITPACRRRGGIRRGRRPPLPRAAALACPVAEPYPAELKLTNNPWLIHPLQIPHQLGLDKFRLINDFAAVAYAVAQVGEASFGHCRGPGRPLANPGVITIAGPGTGLGVVTLIRDAAGTRVVATDGGHGDFAPLDAVDDHILARLRQRFGRVLIERVVSGPALSDLYEILAEREGRGVMPLTSAELWTAALARCDGLATQP